MRRLAVLASLAALAAGLLARRRRRRRASSLAPAARPVSVPAPAPPFVSVAWEPVAAPADRGELTIRCALPAGMELDRVDAQETPTQVFVTALARRRPDGEPGAATAREATVALSGPLGDRELVHAPVDAESSGGGEPTGPSLYP